jgi:hypothetical protein
MKRSDLSHAIRETLKRLPPPYDSHYGIVPPAPPEEGVSVAGSVKALEAAQAAFGKVDAIAAQMKDPYIVSRVLMHVSQSGTPTGPTWLLFASPTMSSKRFGR